MEALQAIAKNQQSHFFDLYNLYLPHEEAHLLLAVLNLNAGNECRK